MISLSIYLYVSYLSILADEEIIREIKELITEDESNSFKKVLKLLLLFIVLVIVPPFYFPVMLNHMVNNVININEKIQSNSKKLSNIINKLNKKT